MSKRITVTIENDLDRKIRSYQAKRIQKEKSSFSYKAINEILKKYI